MTLVVVVVAVLGTACVAPAPRAAWVVPDGPCTDVVLVTLRGSSSPVAGAETRSVHRRFDEAMTALAAGLTYRTVEIGDLDGDGALDPGGYPAVGFDRIVGLDPGAGPSDLPVIGGYNDSRRFGGEELVSVLSQLAGRCPSARFVVAATSMGADAAGSALGTAPTDVLSRIDSVQFFGDPRTVPGPWLRAPDAEIPSGAGLLGPRVPYVPDALALRTTSWCGRFDGTCTGQVWWSVFQLVQECTQLRQFPFCSTRHVDYHLWAHAPAMTEAVRALLDRRTRT